jgi:hypothetical protein
VARFFGHALSGDQQPPRLHQMVVARSLQRRPRRRHAVVHNLQQILTGGEIGLERTG